MGLIDRIFGSGPMTLGLESKAAPYSQRGGMSGDGGIYYAPSNALMLTSPTNRDYQQVEVELSSVLAVCLNTVAGAFPEAELCVDRELADGEFESEPKHPALKLIERPNPYSDGAELLTSIVRDLMTSASGSAYLVKRRTSEGRELWPVSSSIMRPVWPESGDTFIGAYEITLDGKTRLIDPMDVIHFRNGIDHSAPSYGRCGIPYLPPIMRELYTDNAAAGFSAAIMKNLGVPGVVMSPRAMQDGRPVTVPPDVRKEFAADFDSRFTGEGRGRSMVLSHPMDFHQLGFEPAKMSHREIRQMCEERVSGLYNIPAIVCGFGAGLEHGSFANTDQSWKMFWLGCLIPMGRRIGRTLTYQLLRRDYANSENLWMGFEYDDIPALQESETEVRKRDRDDYLAGILTYHQVVSRAGLEPEGDDWLLMPSTVTAYPVGKMPEAPEPPPALVLPPKPDAVPVEPPAKQFKSADLGQPLAWTDEQIEAEAIITDEDIARAEEVIRERSPALADLLDSTEKSAPLETKANYRWNPRTRRYIGANGRMVPKSAVDAAMDDAVESSREVMAGYADRLIEGDWSLVDYQLAMRDEIKLMHTAGVATTRGGWARLTPRERGQAAKRIQVQYEFLDQSVRDFAKGQQPGALKPGQDGYDKSIHGRPLDGTARNSSKMYASSARTAFGESNYEATKEAQEASALTHEERWVRHAKDSCETSASRPGCTQLGRKGWVPLGTHPAIGGCTCLTQCLCEKIVRKKPRKA